MMASQNLNASLPEWIIPLIYAVSAVPAGFLLPRLEHKLLLAHFSASVSVPVALTILSSITSGMIALTGIVFSLAFVMVQFSAVAYSPRLVLWVSRDPVLWHSIGIFTATFLYAIGDMAWIDRAGSGRVPFFSTWIVVILTLASVGMFVALIQRIGLLQINRMLAFTGNLGREVVDQMYPPFEAPPSIASIADLEKPKVTQTVAYSGPPRALQAFKLQVLLTLARQADGCLEMLVTVGDTLINGMPLLRVLNGKRALPDEFWKPAIVTGLDRTFSQDPKYALRLLVDIAIKALSPAINDPTTAVQALDQIQDYLFHLGSRRLEIGGVRDDEGRLRVIIHHPAWQDFLRLGFDEIRYCGANSIQVMRRMSAMIADLIASLPPARRPEMEHHQRRLSTTIARTFADADERLDASVQDRQGLGSPRDRLEPQVDGSLD